MTVSIESRAHRTLAHLTHYKSYDDMDDVSWANSLPFIQEDERVVGVYQNVPNSLDQAILFTTHGVYLHGLDVWQNVRYDDLATIEVEDRSKSEVDELVLHLRSGQTQILPVKGGSKFRDVFEVMRFLDRVVGDVRSGK